MVPRAGFEPATLGLEVLCSIQLSYRGKSLSKFITNALSLKRVVTLGQDEQEL